MFVFNSDLIRNLTRLSAKCLVLIFAKKVCSVGLKPPNPELTRQPKNSHHHFHHRIDYL